MPRVKNPSGGCPTVCAAFYRYQVRGEGTLDMGDSFLAYLSINASDSARTIGKGFKETAIQRSGGSEGGSVK